MTTVEQFFERYKSTAYTKKSLIIKPDQIIDSIFYIKSGYVKQSAIGPNGEEFIINIYKPGSFFAIAIALHRKESHYSFETLTDVVLTKAPTNEIIKLIKLGPDLAQDLLLRITSGLNSLVTRMESLVFGTASQKIAATLWQNAKRFGKILANKTVEIQLPLTHQQLANLAGLTRETVSIEMSKLKKKKILNYQGKTITILSTSQLKILAPLST